MYRIVTPLTQTEQRLMQIRDQLAQGWRVDGPVITREPSPSSSAQSRAFEFILRNTSGFQVIAVPAGPGIDDFLDSYELDTVEI